MTAMNKVGIALVGGALLTLTLVTTATAAQLQASGNISGTVVGSVTEGLPIDPRLGVNVGDLIRGNFSVSFDDSVFSTTANTVDVALTTFNLSVGTNQLTAISPVASFVRNGDFFLFNAIVDGNPLSYQFDNRTISVVLTGGEFPPDIHNGGFNKGEGFLFALGSPGWSSGKFKKGEGGVTQTCEGTGCSFRVNTPATSIPEPSSMLGILAFGALGVGSLKRKQKLASSVARIE